MFIKYIIVSVTIVCSCLLTLYAAENYHYFTEAQSLWGPTGNIQTFSTKTLLRNQWSFGLHKFFIGLSYGILEDIEAGISFNLKGLTPLIPLDRESLERKTDEISIHSKYRILKEEKDSLDMTVIQRRGTFYLTAGKLIESLWDSTLQGGISFEGDRFLTFFAFTQTNKWEQFILDYEPLQKQYNVGWRVLLSPEMKLDFFLTDVNKIKNIFFDNFVFGITVVG